MALYVYSDLYFGRDLKCVSLSRNSVDREYLNSKEIHRPQPPQVLGLEAGTHQALPARLVLATFGSTAVLSQPSECGD